MKFKLKTGTNNQINSKMDQASSNTHTLENSITNDTDYYNNLQARYDSYATWPIQLTQKPIDMASTGLIYSGMADRVICFTCRYSLMAWDSHNIPSNQHIISNPKCKFLTKTIGIEKINKTIEKYKKERAREIQNNLIMKLNVLCIPPKHYTSSLTNMSPIFFPNIHNNKEYDTKTCKICYDQPIKFAYDPCGHCVSCETCNSKITTCPICNTKIGKSLKIYFS